MPPADGDDSFLLTLYSYWDRKRSGRALPDRRDIDPVEIPRPLLPFLFMVELADTPPRWRYRLMGTKMVERLGVDLTGRFHDEALGSKYANYLTQLNSEIRQIRRPLYTESVLKTEDGDTLLTKRMLVPLTAGGDEVAMILGAQTYHGGRAAPPHSMVLTDRGDIEEVRRRLMSE
jgi:hypothetical protein